MHVPLKREASGDERPAKKPKTERRHGACEPCKLSKTKCDGHEPCGACRKEKRKPRTCEYSEKAKNIAAARRDSERERLNHSPSGESEDFEYHEPQIPVFSYNAGTYGQVFQVCDSSKVMHERIALRQVIDEFVTAKPPKGQAAQHIRRVQKHWDGLQSIIMQTHTNWLPIIDPDADGTPASKADDDIAARWRLRLDRILDRINQGSLQEASSLTLSFMRDIDFDEMKTVKKSVPDQSHMEVTSICRSLIEIETLLGFFLGLQAYLPGSAMSKFAPLQRGTDEAEEDDKLRQMKVDLITCIQGLMKIDTRTEAGVWDYLAFVHAIKKAGLAPPIEKMATCITNQEPAEQQSVKLFANLVFVTMYCRTASICGHYSQSGIPHAPRNGSRSDIIHDMNLLQSRQRGTELDQAVKHAGNALNAFERLCEIDPQTVANCWFSLHGTLVAATILKIHGYRQKTADKDAIRDRISKVAQLFVQLKAINQKCPIFEQAAIILDNDEALEARDTSLNTSRHKPVKRLDAKGRDSESDESSSDSDIASPPPPRNIARPKRKLEKAAVPAVARANVRILPDREVQSEDPVAVLHPPMVIPPQMEYSMHPVVVTSASYDYTQAVQPQLNTSFTSETSQVHDVRGAIVAEAEPLYWKSDGTPWTNPPPTMYEPFHPPMIQDPESELLRDQHNNYIQVHYRPQMQPEGSFSSHLQGNSFMPPTYNEPLDAVALQSQLASPDTMAPMVSFGGHQQHASSGEAEGTFFNMTPKSFERSSVSAMPSSTMSNRSLGLSRRYSEQDIHAIAAGAARTWSVHQAHKSSPIYEAARLEMLPPKPEPVVSFQTGHAPGEHYYPYQHHFFNAYTGVADDSMVSYDAHHTMPPHHHHQQFYPGPGITTSS